MEQVFLDSSRVLIPEKTLSAMIASVSEHKLSQKQFLIDPDMLLSLLYSYEISHASHFNANTIFVKR